MNIIVPKVSIYYNHSLTENTGLYIGGGVGAAMISAKITDPTQKFKLLGDLEDKTEFACNGDIGLLFNINKVSLDLCYSFGYYGKPYDFKVMVHTGKVGIRYNF